MSGIIETRVPGVLEPVTGWRAWKVVSEEACDNYFLSAFSLSYLKFPELIWREPYKARCFAKEHRTANYYWIATPHKTPEEKCQCGFYSCKAVANLEKAVHWEGTNQDEIVAVGKVTCWGEIIECEGGYRSEYAKPMSAWIAYPEERNDFMMKKVLYSLEDYYKIPVILLPQPIARNDLSITAVAKNVISEIIKDLA